MDRENDQLVELIIESFLDSFVANESYGSQNKMARMRMSHCSCLHTLNDLLTNMIISHLKIRMEIGQTITSVVSHNE